MNCEKITARAGRLIDETIDDTNFALDVLNEFQEDIAETLTPIGTATITATADTWYDMPTDCIGLYKDDGGYYVTKDGVAVETFEFRELYPKRQVKFYESGTYDILYEKSPSELLIMAQEPNMHPYLHGLGALFLAARYKSIDDDENEDVQRLMNEYEMKKRQRIGKLLHPSGDSGRVEVE
jgi:hypothetical protein